jgi:hypothetical protein
MPLTSTSMSSGTKMKTIKITFPDGTWARMQPAPSARAEDETEDQFFARIAAKDCPEGATWEIVEAEMLPPLPVPVPSFVSSAQALLALDDAGLLPQVQALIGSHPVTAVRIWYERANFWERSNVYVQALAAELGLTDGEVDALFIAAASK